MNAGRSYNRVCGALVIDRLAAQAEQEVPALAALLCDAANGGAWVSFLPPLEEATADVYRREVLASVARGTRVLLVARLGCELVGTVQLELAQPPSGAHRAEVLKLLVQSADRRRGAGCPR